MQRSHHITNRNRQATPDHYRVLGASCWCQQNIIEVIAKYVIVPFLHSFSQDPEIRQHAEYMSIPLLFWGCFLCNFFSL